MNETSMILFCQALRQLTKINRMNNWLQSVTHAKKAIASLSSLVFYYLGVALGNSQK